MAGIADDTRRRLASVLPLTIATVVAVDIAGARAYDSRTFGHLGYATFSAILLGALALLWLRAKAGPSPGTAWARWLGILAVAAAGTSIHVRGILGPGPLFTLGVLAAAGVVIMVVGIATNRTPALLGGAIVSGLALRAFEFKLTPIAPPQGDMLPLVVLAVTNTLNGQPPYRMYHMPWDVPLTYMPLCWLAYAPLLLAGFDPRWTNTLADIAVLGAIYFAGRRYDDKTLRNAAACLWAAWFVAHRIVKYDAGIAAEVQWAALSWLAALAVERNRWTPAVFGAALATTPLALPLAPSIAVAWHRAWNRPASARPHRSNARPLLRATLIAASVGAALIGPWLLWCPNEFVAGVFLWFNDIDRFPREKWLENRAWIVHPGLAGLFWTLHGERLLKPLQALVTAGLAVLYARKTAATGPRATLGGELVAVFLLFLLFNPMVWAYLWEPGVCLALVALSCTRPRPPSASSPRTTPEPLRADPFISDERPSA